jgi:hypothetical protein
VHITQLTNDKVNSDRAWFYDLYQGNVYGQNHVASAMCDNDGIITFDDFPLNPLSNYTLCEIGLPAGWDSQWSQTINYNDANHDGIIQPQEINWVYGLTTIDVEHQPFNPLAPYVFGSTEDIGTRCVILSPEQFYLYPELTIYLTVNSTQPQTGGQARTADYWKSHSACSSGLHDIKAHANGGAAAGFFLLEDTLPRVWDNVLNDYLVVHINTCEKAVSILSARDCDSGKQYASDAAYRLAKHLFAYGSNKIAGSYSCPAAQTAADDALLLLDQINFTCQGPYKNLMTTVLQQRANALAQTLDRYNNNDATL